MSLAATVRAMAEAGCSSEQIALVVEKIDEARREKTREGNRIRQATYRQRNANNALCSVTERDQSPPIKSPPITPIKLTPPTSLRSDTSAREIFANEFWPAYPRKTERKAAEAKFVALVRSGVDPILLVDGARRYAASKPEPKFTKHATTWLARGCWEDELLPRAGPKPNGRSVLAQMATGEYWENHDDESSELHASARPVSDDAGAGNHSGDLSQQTRTERRGILLDLRPEGPQRPRAA